MPSADKRRVSLTTSEQRAQWRGYGSRFAGRSRPGGGGVVGGARQFGFDALLEGCPDLFEVEQWPVAGRVGDGRGLQWGEGVGVGVVEDGFDLDGDTDDAHPSGHAMMPVRCRAATSLARV